MLSWWSAMFLCLWKRDVALNWTGPAETEYVFTRPVLYLQRAPGEALTADISAVKLICCVVCDWQSSGKEQRIVKQMQYMAWPDHGVPDDSSDFLDFVVRVRQCRTGVVEPTVVHCRLLVLLLVLYLLLSVLYLFCILNFFFCCYQYMMWFIVHEALFLFK